MQRSIPKSELHSNLGQFLRQRWQGIPVQDAQQNETRLIPNISNKNINVVNKLHAIKNPYTHNVLLQSKIQTVLDLFLHLFYKIVAIPVRYTQCLQELPIPVQLPSSRVTVFRIHCVDDRPHARQRLLPYVLISNKMHSITFQQARHVISQGRVFRNQF